MSDLFSDSARRRLTAAGWREVTKDGLTWWAREPDPALYGEEEALARCERDERVSKEKRDG